MHIGKIYLYVSMPLLFLTLACSNGDPQSSHLKTVEDIASMQVRSDGRYDVICKNGSFEVVTYEQIRADNVCQMQPNPHSDIQSVQRREDGKFDVLCKNGRNQVATAEQIRKNQVCLGMPENPVGTWAPLPIDGAPAARERHAAVWTGTDLLVWGGYGGGVLNSGARFNPRLGKWIKTAANPFRGRADFVSAWSGNEWFVWGGIGQTAGEAIPGFIYTASSDTWRPMASGGPRPTRQASAVWSPKGMIVWGGEIGIDAPSSGGIYDPQSHTWTATTLRNAPEGRRGNTVIWTGERMIVWGGSRWQNGSSEFLNSGGAYDPRTNSWTALSLNHAPAPRSDARAIWTGSEMIVWGGFASDLEFGDGGIYDPRLNRWRDMSITDAPCPRYAHSAVWTGKEMIIWGGYSRETRTELNDGGIYDPRSNRWRKLSISGAPEPRALHTATWTGEVMIVYGGSRHGNSRQLASGGIFRPN